MWKLKRNEYDVKLCQLDVNTYTYSVYPSGSTRFGEQSIVHASSLVDNGDIPTPVTTRMNQHVFTSTSDIKTIVMDLQTKGFVLQSLSPVSSCLQCVQKNTRHMCNHCGDRYCSQKCYDVGDLCRAKVYFDDIERATRKNAKPLDLVFDEPTDNPLGARLQVGLSSVIKDIPWESHEHVTQFFRVESGKGIFKIVIDGKMQTYPLHDGSAAIIPSGHYHYIQNTSTDGTPLKLYSIYAKDTDMKEWIH